MVMQALPTVTAAVFTLFPSVIRENACHAICMTPFMLNVLILTPDPALE